MKVKSAEFGVSEHKFEVTSFLTTSISVVQRPSMNIRQLQYKRVEGHYLDGMIGFMPVECTGNTMA